MDVRLTLKFGPVTDDEASALLIAMMRYLGETKAKSVEFEADGIPFNTAAAARAGWAIGQAQIKANKRETE